jgi:hypothetical protein
MAGPVAAQISLSIENGSAILRSHGIQSLGDLLPFTAEFWRSSMTALFSRVLEAPFPFDTHGLSVSSARALAQLRANVQLSDRFWC